MAMPFRPPNPGLEEQLHALNTLIRNTKDPLKAVQDAIRAAVNSSYQNEEVVQGRQPEPDGESIAAYAAYPRLCSVLQMLRQHPNTVKKNTVQILHEYASRLFLAVRGGDHSIEDGITVPSTNMKPILLVCLSFSGTAVVQFRSNPCFVAGNLSRPGGEGR